MFKRLFMRWVLLEEAGGAGDAGGGGAPASAAPAATPPAAGAPAAAPAGGATTGAVDGMPKSALGGGDETPPPAGGEKIQDGEPKTGEPPKTGEEPLTYEKFNLPEGVTLDDTKLAAFTKVAGDARISQEVAQQLVDLYTAELTEAVNGAREAAMSEQVKAWGDLNSKWNEEARADPVIGGADFDKNLGAMKTALNNVLGKDAPEFFAALDVYGSGTNHPAILRGLFKALQVHMPPTPVAGAPSRSAGRSPAQALYPNQQGLGNGYEG